MLDDDNSTNNSGNAPEGPPSGRDLEALLDGLLAAETPDNGPDPGPEEAPPAASDRGGFASGFGADDPGEHPKVELDIDDAPFLEDEEPEPPAPREARPPALSEEAEDAAAKAGGPQGFLQRLLKDKKRLALVAGAGLFILLAPLAFLLVSGKKTSPPPKAPEQAETPAPPSQPPTLPENRFVFAGGAFLVPLRGSEGELRFLHLRYTLVTESLQLFTELQQKSIPVRDAVYHYLSHKPLTLLVGEEQARLLRSDLINVINQQLSADKITELNFEEYLITGG